MSLIYFWNCRQNRYWPIIFSKIFHSRFKDRHYTCFFKCIWENTRTNTIINNWRDACSYCFATMFQYVPIMAGMNIYLQVRPKLKLSLFALYRPTRKYPADSKDFIGKKGMVFLLVSTVHRITFIVYLPRQLQKSCKKLGNQCFF